MLAVSRLCPVPVGGLHTPQHTPRLRPELRPCPLAWDDRAAAVMLASALRPVPGGHAHTSLTVNCRQWLSANEDLRPNRGRQAGSPAPTGSKKRRRHARSRSRSSEASSSAPQQTVQRAGRGPIPLEASGFTPLPRGPVAQLLQRVDQRRRALERSTAPSPASSSPRTGLTASSASRRHGPAVGPPQRQRGSDECPQATSPSHGSFSDDEGSLLQPQRVDKVRGAAARRPGAGRDVRCAKNGTPPNVP